MKAWTLSAGALALIAAAFAGASCDVARPDVEPVGPPLHLVSVTAGQSAPIELPLSGEPATISTGSSITLHFDRYLLPTQAVRGSVCLQSDLTELSSLNDCKTGVLLHPRYDPVTRSVTYFLDQNLDSAIYKLTIFTSAASDTATGFRAFDGASLAKNESDQKDLPGKQLSVTFNATVTDGKLETPAVGATYCTTTQPCKLGCERVPYTDPVAEQPGAGQVMAKTCGLTCHVSGDSAVMGMGLDTLGGIQATARDAVAHQTEMGGHAASASLNPARFGVSMPRIASGDPGNSYALYKLLANDAVASWDPTMAEGETDRLRRSVVVGMAMPAQPSSISMTEVEIISQWIAGGWVDSDGNVVEGASFRTCETINPP